MTDVSTFQVQALVNAVAPDVTSFQIQALVNTIAPDVSTFQVQVLVTDTVGPVPPTMPAWIPLYALTDEGWYPTFPRQQFDDHPPRG